ncbi:uncharacterized protein [Montipora capricornis]|uniref:uncharacterized protein n=1 Tax=Montipora capricornis TaxID=246305 RepID=UPI0035F1BCC3
MAKTETICYDGACNLKKFAQNTRSSCLTTISQRMSRMKMLVDRFHFKNHVDSWCKNNCNPYNTEALKAVDTEVCEKLFSWLSKYSHITKHMNRWRFLFLMLYVLENHNLDVEQQQSW